MADNFTLLLLSQHYPLSPQLRILSFDDVSIDEEIAAFLQTNEQQASQHVLDNVYAFAEASVQK